jgi:CubicO group peptidase (beta-lactamase class C family)
MSRIDAAAVAELARAVAEEVDSGRSGAAQFALAVDGDVVASGSYGAADDDTRFVIFSATKTFVAMTLLPHLQRHRLGLTRKVADVLPGFADNGKGETTLLQLLTMQGGFPQALVGPHHWGTSDGRREAFAGWTLDWPSGTRTEYHPVSTHWVIAELIETLSGRSYIDEVNDLMTAAGAGSLIGPHAHQVATVRATGSRPANAHMVPVFGRPDLVPSASVTPEALLSLNEQWIQDVGVPGGGGITRAVDVATAYQLFLDGRDVVPAELLADARGIIRNASINATDGVPANRTIAGVVAGEDGYSAHRWFPDAPRAFGHHGAGGQLCWLEPDRQMSFCFLHDTLSQDPRDDFLRARKLNALALAAVAA